jgi:hypothetical protein
VLAKKLQAEVVAYACLEDLLDSSMDYDVFVVYSLFGRAKMDGWQGVKWIRHQKPESFVVYMAQKRFFERHGSPPGGDFATFCAEDDIEGLVKSIQTRWKAKSAADASGNTEEQ